MDKQTPAGENSIYEDGSYLDKNPTWDVEDAPWKAVQVRRILERNGIRPSSVCEVGCGVGEIIRQLSLSMTEAKFVGYEVSPQAFALCESRRSERVDFRFGNLLAEDVHFDCALCIDVIEHVEDYIGFVRSLKQRATYKVFHIPLEVSISSVLRDAVMAARAQVGHLHYFTRETALATLRDVGYEIIDECYTASFLDMPGRTVRENLARLPRKALYALSPDLLVKTIGGCSLLVLAK
jgi:hypothetical protein